MFRHTADSGPAESPLELYFLATAEKYGSSSVDIACRVPVSTPHGNFRLDVVLAHTSGLIIGVTLDGKTHAAYDADLWRDAAILHSGSVHSIARIWGRDLFLYPHLVWWRLGHRYPKLLDSRARVVLDRQREVGDYYNLSQPIPELGERAVPFHGLEDLDDEEDDTGYGGASEYVDYDDRDRGFHDSVSVVLRSLRTPQVAACIDYLTRYPTLHVRHVRRFAEQRN